MSSAKSSTQDFLVTVMALLTSAAMFLFVFGLPWNTLGLWRQTETISALLYGINALLIAAIGGLLMCRHKDTVDAIANPVVLCLLAFAAVGFGVSAFSDSPMRSIHGTLKHGAGAIWYFELVVMTVSAMVVLFSRWKPMLIGAAVVSLFVLLALYGMGRRQPFGLPLGFNEWVGLAGGLVAFGIVASATTKRGMVAAGVIAAVATVLSYYLSDNRAVALSLIAIGVFAVGYRLPLTRTLIERPCVRAFVVTAMILAGLGGMYVAAPLIEAHREAAPAPATSTTVLSNQAVDQYDMHMGSLGTIWSRSYMVRIVLNDIVEHPGSLLTGHGWGSFETVYETHAREVPGRVFWQTIPSASRAYWDSHEKSNFHSHNMAAEVLYSTGALGLVLWISVFALMSYRSQAGFYAGIGLAVFFTFWFPVNHITMMFALMLATVIAPRKSADLAEKLAFNLAPFAIFLFFAMILLSVLFGRLLVVERYERAFLPVTTGSDPKQCAIYSFPLFPENEVTSTLYRVLTMKVGASKDQAQTIYDYTTNFIALNCMIRNYQQSRPDIVSLVFSLRTRAKYANLGPKVMGAFARELVNWRTDIDELLSIAPGRTEFLAPFINTLGSRAPEKALAEIENYLPALNESDPVRDYLLFVKAQLSDASHEEQRVHLQAAVDKGFGNIWQVTPETIKEFDLK